MNKRTKILSFLLALSVTINAISTIEIVRAYAEVNDINVSESTENNDGPNNNVDPENIMESDDPEELRSETKPEESSNNVSLRSADTGEHYEIVCYSRNIDFTDVHEGEYTPTRTFTIINTGNMTVNLCWEVYDYQTSFKLEIPHDGDVLLDPGEQATFGVHPDSALKQGYYEAYILFYPQGHSIDGIRIDLSANVYKNEPRVTRVEISPGQTTVPVGKSLQYTATVYGENDPDRTVIWSVNGQQSSQTTIDSNGNLYISPNETASSMAVIATSRQDSSIFGRSVVTVTKSDHIVNIKCDPVGAGVIYGGGAVRDGGSLRVSASANSNYRFLGWYENGSLVSGAASYDIYNVTSDRNLTARFERGSCYVRFESSNPDAGSITGGGTVEFGGKMTLTAKAKDGYVFEGFVEDNKIISTSDSIQLNNITYDRKIIASFRQARYTVNVSINPQDTGKVEGSGLYDEGKKVSLKATAYDGYEFVGWTINGQTVSKDVNYNIDKIKSNYNLTANFMKKNARVYRINSGIANEGGGIVPSGMNEYAEGNTVVYNIVPKTGYRVLAVTVDGINVGPVTGYTFTGLNGEHTIIASFTKDVNSKAAATVNNNTATVVNPAPTERPVTVYSDTTAASGAVPEQVIMDDELLRSEIENEEARQEYMVYEPVVMEDTPMETVVAGGILERYGISPERARDLISDGIDTPFLKEAYDMGYLNLAVNNSYLKDPYAGSDDLFYNDPTVNNLAEFTSSLLTLDEKVDLLNGQPIHLSISISDNTELISKQEKNAIQNMVGYRPLSYFDFLILKSADGNTQVVTTTTKEIEVTLVIPEEFRVSGRKYAIIRNHNGVIERLEDLDSNPDTITFRSGKFSQYAIAYEAIGVNWLILRFVLIAVLSLILSIVCALALLRHRVRQKRK